MQAEGAMYVPDDALFSNLLKLPEDEDLGKAINDAMKALEAENEAIKDALPKTYTRFSNDILANLLKNFTNIRFFHNVKFLCRNHVPRVTGEWYVNRYEISLGKHVVQWNKTVENTFVHHKDFHA